MSSFPYAFPQLYPLNGTIATTGTSANLTAGQAGVYDKNTHAVVTTANEQNSPYIYIAQGSYYAFDSVRGTPLQGLKESLKTPGINAKYVTKFYKTNSQPAIRQIIEVGANTQYECGKTYDLRVEAQGADVLRVLNRYMYKILPAFTGCCPDNCAIADCSKTLVDPATVMFSWAKAANEDPLLSMFLTATASKQTALTTGTYTTADLTIDVASATGIVVGQRVTGAGVNAKVTAVAGTVITIDKATTAAGTAAALIFSTIITDAYVPVTDQALIPAIDATVTFEFGYVDTVFGDCSFEPADFYQKEPILGFISIVDKFENVCVTGPSVNSNTGENSVIVQEAQVPQGLGETVVRDYNLFLNYLQLHYQTDTRKKQIEGGDTLLVVDRASFYTRYYLQFSVPVFSNFTNTFDNKQYLVCYAFKAGVDPTAFETLMTQWLAAHNPAVTLKTID